MSTIKTLDVKVNGLHPNKKYRFNFENKGGNWPVRVSPLSGVFYPSSVKTYVYFCSTTGECPPSDPNVFFNTLASDISTPGLDLDNKSLYSVLQLSIREFDCDTVVYTHPCIVECDECIPKLSVSTESINLTSSEGPESIFTASVDGLVPNQSYKYEFAGSEGNWPVKIIPRSGVIKTSDSSYTINGLVSVCQSTGMCPSGAPNVLNYTSMPNNADLLYSLVELSVEPVDTINSNFQSITKSSFSVQCDDCIHRLSVNTPSIINATTATSVLNANLVNMIPGRTYNYSIQPIDANWPVLVHPLSGTVLAASDTADLSFNVRFCPSTGLCPSGTAGLLPYDVANSTSWMSKFARVKIKIEDSCSDTAVVCSNNFGPTSVTYSNETRIVCDNCMPAPQAHAASMVPLTDNFKHNLTNTLGNLMPGSTYNYVFTGLGGNWPATVHPQSGSFVASSTTAQVSADVAFCMSTGVCPNGSANVLPYVVNTSQLDSGAQTIYTKLRIELENTSTTLPKIYGDETLITCNDCLPKVTATIPSGEKLSFTDTYNFDAVIGNTVPGQQYSYIFKNSGSNWPVIIYPISGTVIATSDKETIPVTLKFCASTGVCPTGSPGVLDYNADPICLANVNKSGKHARLKMQVNTINYVSPAVNSNDLSVECDNCLTEPNITIPSIVTLIAEDNYSFLAQISNIVPGETYKYVYKSTNSNWPLLVYPISGTFNAIDSEFNLPTRLVFGSATGVCPTGSKNVLDYSMDSCCTLTNDDIKSVALRLEVEPVNCNYPKIYSNQFFINCDNCIDSLMVTLPSGSILNIDDSQSFSANINNMIVGRTYKYEFKSVDTNWPTVIYPASGTITARSTTASIPAKLTFCPSTGVCPSGAANVLPYNLSSTCISNFGGIDRMAKIRLELTDIGCTDVKAVSNDFALTCNDCTHKLSVVNLGLQETTLTSGVFHTLNSVVNNLIPGESYKYNINYVDSNWPCVITRQSGEFKAVSSSRMIKTDIGFCYPSGSCSQNTEDAILTYRNNAIYDQSNSKFITLNVSVDAVDCSVPRVYSDTFTLLCEGCLPMNQLNTNFSGYPTVSLSGCACSGTQLAIVSVTGAVPNQTYDYTFTSSSNKLTFSPTSGSTVFGASGSGTIMSVMNLSFASGDKSVVQMRLRDPVNSIESVSQLSVQCLNSQDSCKTMNPLYAKFVDAPQLTLQECACSGSRLVSISVTGAVPRNAYDYTLTSTSNTISFSPSSGTMLFGSSGSGSIMSIFNLTLASGDQSIVQFKIKDSVNNIEAIDYLPVKCSGTCE